MQQKYKSTYKNIYFDLDRTLWDFQTNSEQTLKELLEKHAPDLVSRSTEFISIYHQVNELLWIKYREGEITKEKLRTQRFVDTFSIMGFPCNGIFEAMGMDYIKESPLKTGLFPHALETLEYLKHKGYRLFLLTNGFSEVQAVKIKSSGLEPFFEKMITSEEAGYQKPHRKIFEFALKTVNARKKESIMIGDDLENDIFGARRFGMDTIYFNPQKIKHGQNTNFEITSLHELRFVL
jgi:putative hydrolase of the HAD superfamily